MLAPPDTAEIRKVTAAMRTDVLKTAEHHEIRLVSRKVTPTAIATTSETRDPSIIWEGHIASELDYGPDSGAGSVSGS